MSVDPKQRRAARHAQPPTPQPQQTGRKPPITVARITDAALEVVATEGYDALTMRSVAGVLNTGPASLYAHVVNKADIDELIIGRLCSQLVLPEPDPATWREQILDVCAQIRDQYLKYPGDAAHRQRVVALGGDDLERRVGDSGDGDRRFAARGLGFSGGRLGVPGSAALFRISWHRH